MAKGLRSSARKKNNAKLRASVFGPVSDARTERLSQKLQELASLPGPAQKKEDVSMDVDPEAQSTETSTAAIAGSGAEGMDVDEPTKSTSTSSRKRKPSKIEKKKIHRKARNSILFKKPHQKTTRKGRTSNR